MIRPCAVVPTYNNPATLRQVVQSLLEHIETVFVIDDGSTLAGAEAASQIAADGIAQVHRLEPNQGKGAACLAGFQLAHDAGFTHAVQVDADGQHCVDDMPRFLERARQQPEALVCGVPVFGDDAPWSRVIARRISVFWVAVELGSGVVEDPLFGLRVYPLKATLSVPCRSQGMGFDTEIAVQLVFGGTSTENLKTTVRYPDAAEGAVSHFRPVADSWALSCLHARLFFASLGWRLRRSS